jgi:hypothetical protein
MHRMCVFCLLFDYLLARQVDQGHCADEKSWKGEITAEKRFRDIVVRKMFITLFILMYKQLRKNFCAMSLFSPARQVRKHILLCTTSCVVTVHDNHFVTVSLFICRYFFVAIVFILASHWSFYNVS